jgi:F0F1-type ATP synthase assembly protein I
LPDTDPPKKKFWLQAGQISQVAFVLPAATVVGWLLGAGMDRWLHTSWLWIAGLLLGIVAGFVDMIRTVIANSK